MRLVHVLVGICALIGITGCDGNPGTAQCVVDHKNGVYTLGSRDGACLSGGDALSQFIGAHPELEVLAISSVFYTGKVIILTRHKNP